MRGFQITIFIMAVVILIAQTTHFTYVKFFFDTKSAIDDYTEIKIKRAESLDELIKDYKASIIKVKEYEKDKSDETISKLQMQRLEPYKTKFKLETAIKDWESKIESIRKLVIQWTIGLIVLLIGCVVYIKEAKWVGAALVVSGLGEMIWWSSPSLSLVGAVQSFETLLNYKLILSILTLILVLALWGINERREKNL